jgi:hypothetical protein
VIGAGKEHRKMALDMVLAVQRLLKLSKVQTNEQIN